MLQEGYFDKVYYRFFKADNDVVANVFAIHGLGGHCLWFDNAAELFNQNKINFFSFDLPGFGKSKYDIEKISSYDIWIDVTRETLKNFLFNFNVKAPVFILGHSLGALIAIILSKSVKANGWILTVPGFEGHKDVWPWFKFIIPTLCKAVFKPNEKIIMPFGPELITKNRETQLKVKKDPLRVVSPSANIFLHTYFLTELAKRTVKELTEPTLMLMAGKDKVCSLETMECYFNEISSNDKSKKLYTNSFHDLFIEDELPEIVEDITKWITNHVSH